MPRNSILTVIGDAAFGRRSWRSMWRSPALRKNYDVVIVGGGGHGLATAFYLAQQHGLKNVAVIERSVIGTGNVGRNTTIIRSNYLHYQNNRFAEHSLKLWETLESQINYNAMVSQRGVLNLAHSDGQLESMARRGNAMRIAGIDAELLGRDDVRKMAPEMDFDSARWPIYGGLYQARGGTVRHDAVAWGFASAADRLGVDIIQNCEVGGFKIEGGHIRGVETSRGFVGAGKVLLACAGNSSRVAGLTGLRLPIETHILQAYVTEGLKPLVDKVITFGAGHFYVSQSDKGGLVFGGNFDGYTSYSQRGAFAKIEDIATEALALFPNFSRLRLLRSWAGNVDLSMDGSPIVGETEIGGLYINAGWGGSGFKATPGVGHCLASTIADGLAHPLIEPFSPQRFASGQVINEAGTGAQPNLH
jgi:sarcosine oxidase subunit beta